MPCAYRLPPPPLPLSPPARSFNDIVKRLAAQAETDPTFVSKRVRQRLRGRASAKRHLACQLTCHPQQGRRTN